MAEFDPSKAAESFFRQRERGRQEITQESAQAAAVAEMLGYYTPELQQRVTQPLGQNPTAGESLLGAPVRGLGKLFGNEGMQQFGASHICWIRGRGSLWPAWYFGALSGMVIPE